MHFKFYNSLKDIFSDTELEHWTELDTHLKLTFRDNSNYLPLQIRFTYVPTYDKYMQ